MNSSRCLAAAAVAGTLLAAGAPLSQGREAKGLQRTIQLPKPSTEGAVSVEKAIQRRRSVRGFGERPLTLAQASQLLWSAQGVTEAKKGLRSAPSAGACYPLEAYLVAGAVDGLAPGVYRYSPRGHLLALLSEGDARARLKEKGRTQQMIGRAPATIVVSADLGRIRPRYRDRAERYTHMEAGHAGQNVSLQAEALGLGTVMVGAFDDAGVKNALGLPSGETPLYLIPIGVPGN